MFHWMQWCLLTITVLATVIGVDGSSKSHDAAAAMATPPPSQPAPVEFMRRFIGRANPSLLVEDPYCAEQLPVAIHRSAEAQGLAWQTLFVLAWQESYFDCHAKNRLDRGGAFGAYQIRRLWAPVVGDPREDYFDPHVSTARAAGVLAYYQETPRLQELIDRRFRFPLLCLYNSGETQRVNMRYCRSVGEKMRELGREWDRFRQRRFVAGNKAEG